MYLFIIYFIRTKAREYNDERNIFNKWQRYSLIKENFKGNLQKFTIIPPIRPKKRANEWCLYNCLSNITYENIGTKRI